MKQIIFLLFPGLEIMDFAGPCQSASKNDPMSAFNFNPFWENMSALDTAKALAQQDLKEI